MQAKNQISPRLNLIAALDFTRALIRANLRDIRNLVITLLMPLLILVMFYATGEEDDLVMIVPFIVGLTVMFSGAQLATRIISWRTQDIFQRLKAVPVPMPYLMLGMVVSYLVIVLLEAILVLVLSIFLVGLSVDVLSIGFTLLILFCSALCFLSFGAMIANMVSKTETATSFYVFTLIPMFFLGGGMFDIPFLSDMGVILPTSLLTESLTVLTGASLPNHALLYPAGLLAYTAIFSLIAARYFQRH
jgi:ABC-2 type transport system permease protein